MKHIESFEVQICLNKKVIWEGVIQASNTVDAQYQAIQSTNNGFGIAMYDYINVDRATDNSVWSLVN